MKMTSSIPILLSALLFHACLHDEHHDDDGADVLADACAHMGSGPDVLPENGELHGELAHKRWKLALSSQDGGYGGEWNLEIGDEVHAPAKKSDEALELNFFFDNAVEVSITRDTQAIAAVAEAMDLSPCPSIAAQATYALEPGTYTLTLSGAADSVLHLVVGENEGHDAH